jgi:hypothetical protein
MTRPSGSVATTTTVAKRLQHVAHGRVTAHTSARLIWRQDATLHISTHLPDTQIAYKYYNMDQVVAQALATHDRIAKGMGTAGESGHISMPLVGSAVRGTSQRGPRTMLPDTR